MIQRIQTLYLLAAAVLSIVSACLLWGEWLLLAVLFISAALGIYTIFGYNNRKSQMKLCTFNILLLVGWFVLYIVLSQLALVAVFQWSALLPALSLLCYFLARRGIDHDEKLVRAADRIR